MLFVNATPVNAARYGPLALAAKMWHASALLVLCLAACQRSSKAQGPEQPSFSCAQVTSQVNRLICSTPSLAALDRELALVFNNMEGQPVDRKRLRQDEDAWLAALHRDCSDAGCIENRYRDRLRTLRDTSLRLASPAAYDETRPFAVAEDLRLRAEMSVGRACSTQAGLVDASVPGFLPAPSFQPVLGSGFVLAVRQAGERRFAFLLTPSASKQDCVVRDQVALPPGVQARQFLQCSSVDPAISGFGIRGAAGLVAFWTVNPEELRIERVPVKVLGIDGSVRCHQPESGE